MRTEPILVDTVFTFRAATAGVLKSATAECVGYYWIVALAQRSRSRDVVDALNSVLLSAIQEHPKSAWHKSRDGSLMAMFASLCELIEAAKHLVHGRFGNTLSQEEMSALYYISVAKAARAVEDSNDTDRKAVEVVHDALVSLDTAADPLVRRFAIV